MYRRYNIILVQNQEVINELIEHLRMNGYEFGINRFSDSIYIREDQDAEFETIMNDRGIVYEREE